MKIWPALVYACVPLALLVVSSPLGCASDDDADGSPGVPDVDSGVSSEPDVGTIEDAGPDVARFEDAAPPCNEGGWCRTPLPGTPAPSLKGIFSVSPTRAFATGETCIMQGRVYTCTTSIYTWNGTTWSTAARGLDKLTSIWASDADHLWAVNESKRSIVAITFDGSGIDFTTESIPYDFGWCGDVKLSISGSSASNVYVAGYCYSGDQTTGLLFRRRPTEAGAAPTWSVVWSGGGSWDYQVGFGGVYVEPSGEAWVAGWKVLATNGSWSAKSYIPGPMRTLVLHVPGGDDAVVEERMIDDPTLATCAQSIWAGDGTVLVGGICDSGYDDYTKYTTLVRYGQMAGGGTGWSKVYETPVGQWGAIGSSFTTVHGFSASNVYAVGSWAMDWNGTSLETVSLAINGAPIANRVVSVHGSAPNEVWMVGNGFAMHRSQ